jgi:Endomembrane protein 70
MERRVDITNVEVPIEVSFSYSVEWVDEPDLKWKDRMSRYVDSKFIPSSFEIHWYGLFDYHSFAHFEE